MKTADHFIKKELSGSMPCLNPISGQILNELEKRVQVKGRTILVPDQSGQYFELWAD